MRRFLLALALVGAGLIASPLTARAATHQVRVEDNVFLPKLLQIEPGDTVAWSALRPGHSITADDRRFDFHADRTLNVGEQVTHRFDTEEDVRYYCRIHGGPGGQGMSGVIRVGDPPRPPVPETPTLVVPDDAPTVADAAAGAQPGTQVLVRPGVYPEDVVVTVPRVTIRGLGSTPGDVVLAGGATRDVGLTVAADGVRIENLTVTGYRAAGIVVEDVTGTVVANVTLLANGLYGLDARGTSGVSVRDLQVAGHGVAGVAVRDCEACGARIEGGRFEQNAAGIIATGANGVMVRGADVHANAVGIVLRDVDGAHVVGNTLTDNDTTEVWVAALGDGPEPPTGAGVLISGGRGNLIASNRMSGHTYNVAITGPAPSLEHRVVGNSVGEATYADLGWDGLGAGVCYHDNATTEQGDLTAHPPSTVQAYDCDAPPNVGIPFPLVTTNLARHAAETGYPA